MKTALITTTINVPKVLELYKKFAPDDARFFVAMDKKTPEAAFEFCTRHGMTIVTDGGYESSALTGWNTDSRRNFALLEALKWGADLIVSVDDDMIPMNGEWVRPELFIEPYDGLHLGGLQQWFDVGGLFFDASPQRGLPPERNIITLNPTFTINAKIGAAQGIILGVPDTDAITSLSKGPVVIGTHDILRSGFVLHPQAYAVFNSQLTAFRREFAPAFAQFYAYQGRNTDIFASMLMRRVMAERNYYTYYGPPTGFHARQPRPLFKDLKAELYGMENIAAFARYLSDAEINGKNVIADCEHLMLNCPIFSDELKTVAAAWYQDCEKVM